MNSFEETFSFQPMTRIYNLPAECRGPKTTNYVYLLYANTLHDQINLENNFKNKKQSE